MVHWLLGWIGFLTAATSQSWLLWKNETFFIGSGHVPLCGWLITMIKKKLLIWVFYFKINFLIYYIVLICRWINSTQKFKLLGEVIKYNLYYSLTQLLEWKLFELETYTDPHYLVLNFYQINKNDEIWTRDHLVIKALIPCQ